MCISWVGRWDLLQVLSAVIKNDLQGLVDTRPLKAWKETLALICTVCTLNPKPLSPLLQTSRRQQVLQHMLGNYFLVHHFTLLCCAVSAAPGRWLIHISLQLIWRDCFVAAEPNRTESPGLVLMHNFCWVSVVLALITVCAKWGLDKTLRCLGCSSWCWPWATCSDMVLYLCWQCWKSCGYLGKDIESQERQCWFCGFASGKIYLLIWWFPSQSKLALQLCLKCVLQGVLV